MYHNNQKYYSACPHRLQPTRGDYTVLVQWLSSVNACAANLLDNDFAESHFFPSQ